jgi:diaminohydroxyphosphoribosylaminopyrimidine deaminase/5-amino-6-(5-phosphoribosylamino)uracil reductase
MFSSSDTEFMRQALSLAARGLFTTDPNPRVGCVIVKGQSVVGKGWHERAGHAHAEVHALAEAGALAKQATVYAPMSVGPRRARMR